MTRPTKQEYFAGIVKAVALRGTCDRGQSGAVIVKDGQIISTGYVGSAAGDGHCDDEDHMYEHRIKDLSSLNACHYSDGDVLEIRPTDYTSHCVRTIHAEQNAICQAAKHGVSVNGATIYSSMVPCRSCAMMIINSGISKVIALREYQTSKHTKQLFKKCNVELFIIDKSLNKY